MNFKFLSALALLSVVAAQSDMTSSTADTSGSAAMPMPSGGPGPAVPSCLQTCIGQSGCDPTDVTCLCSTGLQTLTSCVMSSCSPADQTTAASLEQSLCASASMSAGMNSTMISGSATTEAMNSTSAASSTPSSRPATLTTPSATLTPRPVSTNVPTSSASSASAAATSTNAAAPQNIVAQGVWVMVAGLIGMAVAA